jgi:hypothetical protein
MLVHESIFGALRWVTLGSFVVAVLAALRSIPKNVEPKSPRAAKIKKGTLIVLAGLVVLAVLAFGVEPFGGAVLILTDATNDGASARRVLFGTCSYTFRDGHVETIRSSGGTSIVNDSGQLRRVELVSYGDLAAAVGSHLVDPPKTVAPNATTIVDHGVHFIGPNDPPPPEVQGIHSANRYWLIW